MIKYPEPRADDGILLRLREDYQQTLLDVFDTNTEASEVRPRIEVVGHTSNFLNNMRLPVHRWFRYSAGFSAEWVKWLLAERNGSQLRVLDPFVGSGTTCLACDEMGVPSYGLEAHPFVHRVARAKLSYAADPERLLAKAESAFRFARNAKAANNYPELIGGPHCLDHGAQKIRWASAVCCHFYFCSSAVHFALQNPFEKRERAVPGTARPPSPFS
jgi:hypothetical protein